MKWPSFAPGEKVATRKAGRSALVAAVMGLPNLVGGSADLAESNGTNVGELGMYSPADRGGRQINFGVREHAMAAISNGLYLHGGVRPFCATFLVFHDYMRPAVRLSALMGLPVVYLYSHDSIHVGEDGPTHQPIEHLMAMRTIPNLWVVRPGDPNEAVEAWKLALTRQDGPVALCVTRQNLTAVDRSTHGAVSGLHRGAYVLAEADGPPALALLATGSEVGLALDAREQLQARGVPTRVVSMPCLELFDAQDAAYKASVLLPGVPRISIEAGITAGWARWVGDSGASVGIDRFGASAPGPTVADRLGMNVANVVATASRVLGLAQA